MKKARLLASFLSLTLGLTSFAAYPSAVYAEALTDTAVDEENDIIYGDVYFPMGRANGCEMYAGDKLDLSNIPLELVTYSSYDNDYRNPILYHCEFTVGSGLYSDMYTLDTSQVDVNTPGDYKVIVRPKKGAVGTFTTKDNRTSVNPGYAPPDGDYDICMKGMESYFPVKVYEKAEAAESPLYLKFYTEAIEIPGNGGTMMELVGAKASKVKYEVADTSIAKVNTANSSNKMLALDGLKEGETTVTVYASDGRTLTEKIKVLPPVEVPEGPDIRTGTTTTVAGGTQYVPTTTTKSTVSTVDKWWYDLETTTTTTIAHTSMSEKETTTTTTTAMIHTDYRTLAEYDKSPMKVGTTRKIIFKHPETGTADDLYYVGEATDNIMVTHEKGTNYVVVTALSEGKASFSAAAKGCAFPVSVQLEITAADEFTGTPEKIVYQKGEELDLSGIKTADGKDAEIAPEEITLTGPVSSVNKHTAKEFTSLADGKYIVRAGNLTFNVYIDDPEDPSRYVQLKNARVTKAEVKNGPVYVNFEGIDETFYYDADAGMRADWTGVTLKTGDVVSGVLRTSERGGNATYIYCGDIEHTGGDNSTQDSSYYIFYKDIDTKAIDEEAEQKRHDYIYSLYETETDQNEVDRKSGDYYQEIRLELLKAAYKNASGDILRELGISADNAFCSGFSPVIVCPLNEEQLNTAKNSPNITQVTAFSDFELSPQTDLYTKENIIEMFTTDKDGNSVLGEGIKTDVLFNSGPKKDTDYLIVYGLSDEKEIIPMLNKINANTLYTWETPIEVEPFSGNRYYLISNSPQMNNPINMIIFVDDVIPGILRTDISDYSKEVGFNAAPYVISLGDTNGDYIVDGRDASDVLTAYAAASTENSPELSAADVKKMDVNKDGKVDAVDASCILSYYTYTSVGGKGLISQFISNNK
ncbi:MAG: hypothetical protein J5926_04790 [Ruminococcus sp.]|nr:hypothetical protein [Ruminococcus sp.]